MAEGNNPVSHQVMISMDRLNEPLVDDVLEKISCLAHHSEDASLLAQENDGYVPEDCVEHTGMCYRLCLPKTNLLCTQNLKMVCKEVSELMTVDSLVDDSIERFNSLVDGGKTCCEYKGIKTDLFMTTDAESVPLCLLGVVNVTATEVTNNKFFWCMLL